jgi:hypothetical protein
VDDEGSGAVELNRLIDCFQSNEFKTIVEKNIALSIIFGNGYLSNNSHPTVPLASDRHSIIDPEVIPSLLPVFVDTFSERELASEISPKDIDGGLSRFSEGIDDQERPDSATFSASTRGLMRVESSRSNVDWISRTDFLEFCQAVVDIKLFSIVSTDDEYALKQRNFSNEQ